MLRNQNEWNILKNSMIDFIKESDSLPDFLARGEQFKKPLHLHFNITTNIKGEVVRYGSIVSFIILNSINLPTLGKP